MTSSNLQSLFLNLCTEIYPVSHQLVVHCSNKLKSNLWNRFSQALCPQIEEYQNIGQNKIQVWSQTVYSNGNSSKEQLYKGDFVNSLPQYIESYLQSKLSPQNNNKNDHIVVKHEPYMIYNRQQYFIRKIQGNELLPYFYTNLNQDKISHSPQRSRRSQQYSSYEAKQGRRCYCCNYHGESEQKQKQQLTYRKHNKSGFAHRSRAVSVSCFKLHNHMRESLLTVKKQRMNNSPNQFQTVNSNQKDRNELKAPTSKKFERTCCLEQNNPNKQLNRFSFESKITVVALPRYEYKNLGNQLIKYQYSSDNLCKQNFEFKPKESNIIKRNSRRVTPQSHAINSKSSLSKNKRKSNNFMVGQAKDTNDFVKIEEVKEDNGERRESTKFNIATRRKQDRKLVSPTNRPNKSLEMGSKSIIQQSNFTLLNKVNEENAIKRVQSRESIKRSSNFYTIREKSEHIHKKQPQPQQNIRASMFNFKRQSISPTQLPYQLPNSEKQKKFNIREQNKASITLHQNKSEQRNEIDANKNKIHITRFSRNKDNVNNNVSNTFHSFHYKENNEQKRKQVQRKQENKRESLEKQKNILPSVQQKENINKVVNRNSANQTALLTYKLPSNDKISNDELLENGVSGGLRKSKTSSVSSITPISPETAPTSAKSTANPNNFPKMELRKQSIHNKNSRKSHHPDQIENNINEYLKQMEEKIRIQKHSSLAKLNQTQNKGDEARGSKMMDYTDGNKEKSAKNENNKIIRVSQKSLHRNLLKQKQRKQQDQNIQKQQQKTRTSFKIANKATEKQNANRKEKSPSIAHINPFNTLHHGNKIISKEKNKNIKQVKHQSQNQNIKTNDNIQQNEEQKMNFKVNEGCEENIEISSKQTKEKENEIIFSNKQCEIVGYSSDLNTSDNPKQLALFSFAQKSHQNQIKSQQKPKKDDHTKIKQGIEHVKKQSIIKMNKEQNVVKNQRKNHEKNYKIQSNDKNQLKQQKVIPNFGNSHESKIKKEENNVIGGKLSNKQHVFDDKNIESGVEKSDIISNNSDNEYNNKVYVANRESNIETKKEIQEMRNNNKQNDIENKSNEINKQDKSEQSKKINESINGLENYPQESQQKSQKDVYIDVDEEEEEEERKELQSINKSNQSFKQIKIKQRQENKDELKDVENNQIQRNQIKNKENLTNISPVEQYSQQEYKQRYKENAQKQVNEDSIINSKPLLSQKKLNSPQDYVNGNEKMSTFDSHKFGVDGTTANQMKQQVQPLARHESLKNQANSQRQVNEKASSAKNQEQMTMKRNSFLPLSLEDTLEASQNPQLEYENLNEQQKQQQLKQQQVYHHIYSLNQHPPESNKIIIQNITENKEEKVETLPQSLDQYYNGKLKASELNNNMNSEVLLSGDNEVYNDQNSAASPLSEDEFINEQRSSSKMNDQVRINQRQYQVENNMKLGHEDIQNGKQKQSEERQSQEQQLNQHNIVMKYQDFRKGTDNDNNNNIDDESKGKLINEQYYELLSLEKYQQENQISIKSNNGNKIEDKQINAIRQTQEIKHKQLIIHTKQSKQNSNSQVNEIVIQNQKKSQNNNIQELESMMQQKAQRNGNKMNYKQQIIEGETKNSPLQHINNDNRNIVSHLSEKQSKKFICIPSEQQHQYSKNSNQNISSEKEIMKSIIKEVNQTSTEDDVVDTMEISSNKQMTNQNEYKEIGNEQKISCLKQKNILQQQAHQCLEKKNQALERKKQHEQNYESEQKFIVQQNKNDLNHFCLSSQQNKDENDENKESNPYNDEILEKITSHHKIETKIQQHQLLQHENVLKTKSPQMIEQVPSSKKSNYNWESKLEQKNQSKQEPSKKNKRMSQKIEKFSTNNQIKSNDKLNSQKQVKNVETLQTEQTMLMTCAQLQQPINQKKDMKYISKEEDERGDLTYKQERDSQIKSQNKDENISKNERTNENMIRNQKTNENYNQNKDQSDDNNKKSSEKQVQLIEKSQENREQNKFEQQSIKQYVRSNENIIGGKQIYKTQELEQIYCRNEENNNKREDSKEYDVNKQKLRIIGNQEEFKRQIGLANKEEKKYQIFSNNKIISSKDSEKICINQQQSQAINQNANELNQQENKIDQNQQKQSHAQSNFQQSQQINKCFGNQTTEKEKKNSQLLTNSNKQYKDIGIQSVYLLNPLHTQQKQQQSKRDSINKSVVNITINCENENIEASTYQRNSKQQNKNNHSISCNEAEEYEYEDNQFIFAEMYNSIGNCPSANKCKLQNQKQCRRFSSLNKMEVAENKLKLSSDMRVRPQFYIIKPEQQQSYEHVQVQSEQHQKQCKMYDYNECWNESGNQLQNIEEQPEQLQQTSRSYKIENKVNQEPENQIRLSKNNRIDKAKQRKQEIDGNDLQKSQVEQQTNDSLDKQQKNKSYSGNNEGHKNSNENYHEKLNKKRKVVVKQENTNQNKDNTQHEDKQVQVVNQENNMKILLIESIQKKKEGGRPINKEIETQTVEEHQRYSENKEIQIYNTKENIYENKGKDDKMNENKDELNKSEKQEKRLECQQQIQKYPAAPSNSQKQQSKSQQSKQIQQTQQQKKLSQVLQIGKQEQFPKILQRRLITKYSIYNDEPISIQFNQSNLFMKTNRFTSSTVEIYQHTLQLISALLNQQYVADYLCTKNGDKFALFINNQWRTVISEKCKDLKHEQQSQLKSLENIIVYLVKNSMINLNNSIQCLQLLTGCIYRTIKKDKILKALMHYLSAQSQSNSKLMKNKYEHTILVKMAKDYKLYKALAIQTYLSPENAKKYLIKCLEPTKHLHNNHPYINIQLQKLESVYLVDLASAMQFHTIPISQAEPNTFELQVQDIEILCEDSKLKYLIYEEIEENKYNLQKEMEKYFKFTTKKDNTNYLLIVQPLKQQEMEESSMISIDNKGIKGLKKDKNKITLRYIGKEQKNSSLNFIEIILKCNLFAAKKSVLGGYENMNNLYVPAIVQDQCKQNESKIKSRLKSKERNNTNIESESSVTHKPKQKIERIVRKQKL